MILQAPLTREQVLDIKVGDRATMTYLTGTVVQISDPIRDDDERTSRHVVIRNDEGNASIMGLVTTSEHDWITLYKEDE